MTYWPTGHDYFRARCPGITARGERCQRWRWSTPFEPAYHCPAHRPKEAP